MGFDDKVRLCLDCYVTFEHPSMWEIPGGGKRSYPFVKCEFRVDCYCVTGLERRLRLQITALKNLRRGNLVTLSMLSFTVKSGCRSQVILTHKLIPIDGDDPR